MIQKNAERLLTLKKASKKLITRHTAAEVLAVLVLHAGSGASSPPQFDENSGARFEARYSSIAWGANRKCLLGHFYCLTHNSFYLPQTEPMW